MGIHLMDVFTLVWSNAPLGAHSLTAKATDAVGLVGISAPVNIAVALPPPPPTNPPPVRRQAAELKAQSSLRTPNV